MIVPIQKDNPLLADIAAASPDDEVLHAWWLGQSGFAVMHAGRLVVFDPYLSDSLTVKYAATDRPHVRMTERCLDPARLTGVSVVTSSHMHTDHFDAETLVPLLASNPEAMLVMPGANLRAARERLGTAMPDVVAAMTDGDEVEIEGMIFRGVVAAHNEVERDELGRSRFMGFWMQAGPFRIYHSGDTLWHDDIVRDLRLWGCDLALLPINGNQPERRVAGNLNGTEAAALARAVRARLVVPHHFEMFEFNTDSPDEFCGACARLSQPCRVLRCGEHMQLHAERD